MIRILILIWSTCVFSQQGYDSNHSNTKLKGWEASSEFNKKDVKVSDYNSLNEKFLNKTIKPIYISKEFREFRYNNFYHDKNLNRLFSSRKRRGFKQHSSNGAGGTLVYYRANTNYEFLHNIKFVVKKIHFIKNLKHIAKTDDSNYVFELYNKDIGKVFYKYNSKFENLVEIELVY